MKYLRLELKVCEACGALWLRASLTRSVYCHTCSHRLVHFPERPKHAGGRPRRPACRLTRTAAHAPQGGAR